MSLAELHGGYLFQLRPDLFPWGYLTELEVALWARFYDERDARRQHKE
jgi:hypothetical protein